MTDVLVHRGPDGAGFHRGPGIGLGRRRLALIDLAGGDQPIFNETETVCVVFNGEIYNFQPLIRELSAPGRRFGTRSDTEVIVHGWEEWGEACLDRFNGMFASRSGTRGPRRCSWKPARRFVFNPLAAACDHAVVP